MENQQNGDQKKELQNKQAAAYFMLFELGIEFAVILALPLIAFIYGGRWLDSKYDTKIFVVAGILLALTLSSYMIYRKINEVRKMLK